MRKRRYVAGLSSLVGITLFLVGCFSSAGSKRGDYSTLFVNDAEAADRPTHPDRGCVVGRVKELEPVSQHIPSAEVLAYASKFSEAAIKSSLTDIQGGFKICVDSELSGTDSETLRLTVAHPDYLPSEQKIRWNRYASIRVEVVLQRKKTH